MESTTDCNAKFFLNYLAYNTYLNLSKKQSFFKSGKFYFSIVSEVKSHQSILEILISEP